MSKMNPPKEYIIGKLKRDITKIYQQHYDALYKDKDNMRAVFLRAVALGFQEALNRIVDVEFSPLPDYGDLFTKRVFTLMCGDGTVTSHDGTGYYALQEKFSD